MPTKDGKNAPSTMMNTCATPKPSISCEHRDANDVIVARGGRHLLRRRCNRSTPAAELHPSMGAIWDKERTLLADDARGLKRAPQHLQQLNTSTMVFSASSERLLPLVCFQPHATTPALIEVSESRKNSPRSSPAVSHERSAVHLPSTGCRVIHSSAECSTLWNSTHAP